MFFPTGMGHRAKTEKDFVQPLEMALRHHDSFSILDMELDKMDHSPAMQRPRRKSYMDSALQQPAWPP